MLSWDGEPIDMIQTSPRRAMDRARKKLLVPHECNGLSHTLTVATHTSNIFLI
jgi:hypothetical protein